jgi:hypothetical protein
MFDINIRHGFQIDNIFLKNNLIKIINVKRGDRRFSYVYDGDNNR